MAHRVLVIFRFHNQFEICRERLDALRALNPETEIVGFYGGPRKDWKQAKQLEWDDCYLLRDKIDQWKWQYGDRHLRKWYKRRGHRRSFSHVCMYEWDLVFTRSLNETYPHFENDLLTTSPLSIEERRASNWPWLTEPYLAPEREAFEEWARRKLQWDGGADIGLLPGALISRRLLDAYAGVRPPRGGNDELRLGILAAAFSLTHGDTAFGDPECFNCDRNEISPEQCISQSRETKAKVFHPVYQTLETSASP